VKTSDFRACGPAELVVLDRGQFVNTSFSAVISQSGQTGQRIAAFDWSQTTLGDIETWPQIVRSTVLLVLKSPLAITTLWGPEGVLIYNDSYAAFAGSRDPGLLGMKVLEAWPEAADLNSNVLKTCLAGGTLSYEDQPLILYRDGEPDEVWVDLDYSPILDADGKAVAVFAVVVETTDKVLSERWLSGEHDRLRLLFDQAPGFMAILNGPDHVFDIINPAYLQLVGHRDIVGRSVREALPEIAGQGFLELLDEVYTTGEPFTGKALRVDLQREKSSTSEEKHIDLVYQPIRDRKGKITGIFAQGTDVSERLAAEAALRLSGARHRQILDSAVDYAIIAFDTDGNVTRWNKGATTIFGWAEEEILGRDASRIFTPADQEIDRIATEMGLAIRNGTANDERWHIRKSGELFWASGEMSPLLDDAGNLAGFVKVLRDRTAEYTATEKLKRTEERLRRAQEAGGVGVFSISVTDDVLDVSPEFCRIFGLDNAENVSAKTIEDMVLPEDQDPVSHAGTRNSQTAPLDVQYRIRRADNGEVRIIARKAEFEFAADGSPVRLVGVVQDVTERDRSIQALHASEARFKAFAQAMPNHVWSSTPDGLLDWFNERTYAYSGASEGELDGRAWVSIVHPEDVDAAGMQWLEALTTGHVYEAEFRLRRHDGVYRWHLARAVPKRDDKGNIVRWIGTNTDINDLRATREALDNLTTSLERQVEERTADRDRMWRLSTEIMLVAGMDAKVLAANPAMLETVELTEEELLGQSFMDYVHPSDRQATLDEVAKLAQGVRTLNFVNRYRGRGGAYRTIAWTAVPDNNVIHAVGRDVTAEQEATERLRKTELALQQSQKMESIGNLTGGVAHDFNNLLQVVSGNLQLLSKEVLGNERAERRIAHALDGVNRGAKLASQLLSFGRRQPLEPKVINIGRLVTGMDDLLKRSLGEAIEIETVAFPNLWNIQVDPTQVENALLNLAINARDAMDGSGRLTIEARNTTLDDTYAKANPDVEPGPYVMLAVSDTGSGMTPDVLNKVFEPFFSTKPEGKGTGLGLSMVFGFVKQSGGHIKIYSELGEGTSIKLYFPQVLSDEDQIPDVDVRKIEGGNETILVAEDDEAVRATVVELLRDLGYSVMTAKDAESARVVLESGVHVDLLFTDVVMPGSLKSPELARIAREKNPSMAVLFTSGYTENSIVHGGRLDAGVELLSKPYTKEAMARKIRHVLANQAQRHQSVAKIPQADRAETKISSALDILLVEDDVLIRLNTSDMLQELGHTVTEAGNGHEALALATEGNFDVLFTDVGLPGMSGIELAKKARDQFPNLTVIFATGDPNVPALSGSGITKVLLKPYGEDDLLSALSDSIS
jgi:PAS domain S-box-containing protein